MPEVLSGARRVGGMATGMVLLALAGCPGPSPLNHKDHPEVARLRGTESARAIESKGQPLIVDWQPEQRGDLEVAMHEGVAVVSYTTAGLKLLKDCHIDGEYGFIGISKKEQVIRLLSDEEVKANLPLGGGVIAARLGGELARGAALDIAIVMVGKKRTTWENVTHSDLQGSCEGATHFVRGATIGAFAMTRGMKDRAVTVAGLFGAGVSASTSNSSAVTSRDGELRDCDTADPEAARPPSKCSALLRLELSPLRPQTSAAASKEPLVATKRREQPKAAENECPPGLVLSEGKCTKAAEATTHLCKVGDLRDCKEQCQKGHAASCGNLGYMLATGTGIAKDPTQAAELFVLGCEREDPKSCLNLGIALYNGHGIPRDLEKAAKLYLLACQQGEPLACRALGGLFFAGREVPKDLNKAAALWSKACQGGDEESCSDLGFIVAAGVGVPKNDRLAASLFKRACDGDVTTGCVNYAYMLEFGKGVSRNPATAARLYDRTCRQEPTNCHYLGVVQHVGKGIAVDVPSAKANYEKACAAKYQTSCATLNVFFGLRKPLDLGVIRNDVDAWIAQCQGELERDCSSLAVIAQALGKQALATRVAGRACVLGDEWGCALLKHIGAPRPGTAPAAPALAEFGL